MLYIDFPDGIERASPARNQQYLAKLAEECRRFTPLVGWGLDEPPTGLVLDVHGTLPLFGGANQLVEAVAAWLDQQQLEARLVLADTMRAAWAIARWGTWSAERWRAERWRIVASDELLGVLESLPLAALRLSAATEALLLQLGFDRLGVLFPMPRAALASRLGPEVLQRLDQLLGRQAEPLMACPHQVAWEEVWTSEYPLESWDGVLAAAEKLWQRLAQRLAQRGQGALQVACSLRCVHGGSIDFTISMFAPSAQVQPWVAQMRLRVQRLVLPEGIDRLTMRVVQRAPLDQRQVGLWSDVHPSAVEIEREQAWSEWVTRSSNRLGSQRVLGGVHRASLLPERAWDAFPLVGGAARRRATAAGLREPTGYRPVWLCDPPQPLQVMVAQPGSVPLTVRQAGRSYLVWRVWGPERLETGWWRGPCVRRDYYRVVLEDGRYVWIFRQRTDGAWYLHGYFG